MIEVLKNKDLIEVVSISNIYNRDEEDNLILIKSDVKIKHTIYKYDIEHVREVVNENGNIRNKRVELGLRSKEPITIIGSYKEYKNLITDIQKPIVGFKLNAK